jgi:hypothetical protein
MIMASLAGQRATFTWALNQYNIAETEEKKAVNARRMAKVIADVPGKGFTVEQVTQGQAYPQAEVERYLSGGLSDVTPEVTETQALRAVEEAVDTSDVLRIGNGQGTVYAYSYRCTLDRLKVGLTAGETVPRIVAKISTSTPDKPVLLLEIRTHDCASLERAIHAVLEYRGRRVQGGSKEWFKATREEVVEIYRSVAAEVAKNTDV